PDVVELLVRRGANLESTDQAGWSPLMMSVETSMRELLLNLGATLDLNTMIAMGRTDELKALMQRDSHWIRWAPLPEQLLFDAIRTRNPVIVELLLDHGVPVDTAIVSSALCYACSDSRMPLQIIESLLLRGADPLARSAQDKLTP